MKLLILVNYGGRLTGEHRIEPGEYEPDDSRLFGLGDYLVAAGHARPIIDVDEPLDDRREGTDTGSGETAPDGDEDTLADVVPTPQPDTKAQLLVDHEPAPKRKR